MAPWTPDKLGSPLRGFFEGDTNAGADASAVSAWTDQTANAYVLGQATGANQPIVKTNILNGHRVVRFDGVDDFLTGPANAMGLSAQPFGYFLIWKPANAGSQCAIQWSIGNAGLYIDTTATQLTMFAGSAFFNNTHPAGAWTMVFAAFNGAASRSVVNGVATTGNPGASAPNGASVATVGAASGGGAFRVNGDIATLLVFNTALSQADEDRVHGWGAWKYGLQANLPVSHRYAGAAPLTTNPRPMYRLIRPTPLGRLMARSSHAT